MNFNKLRKHEFAFLLLVKDNISLPGAPFGQVPVLEVDGKPLAQSNAIARYLARQHGLAGQNEWEQSQADMYVDCIYDLIGGKQVNIDLIPV